MPAPCPQCSSTRTTVYNVDHIHDDVIRRNRLCKDCGHSWKRHEDRNGNIVNYTRPSQRANNAVFTEADIIRILEDDASHAQLAREYNINAGSITRIRLGETYQTVAPWIPRWEPGRAQKNQIRPTCRRCIHWKHEIDSPKHNFPMGTPCTFGFPDPIIENTYFAKDCNCYVYDEHSPVDAQQPASD